MELISVIIVIWLIILFIKRAIKTSENSSQSDGESNSSRLATRPTSPYHYGRKRYLMTQAENSFFKILTEAVGTHANVFPQVRLSSLLYRAKGIEGRYWRAALARINQKSVDYVLCDKITGEILLVIELDDITHDTTIREKRDADVNTMLEEAGMPFVRFRNVRNLTQETIASHIYEVAPLLFQEGRVLIPSTV